MADTTTTNLLLTKPEVGASTDTWGTKVNADLDTIDALFDTGPVLKVSKGGTGAATLTANNVVLGNGTSAVQLVAPSTTGNVLTSNGTTWTSAAAAIATGFGFKNRIINGAMVIDQRNAGASVSTSSGTSIYAVDRCKIYYTQTSKFTVQQNAGSVTPPSGFINYVGATSSSAYTAGSTDRFMVGFPIEGLNVADLGWGAAGASTVTISFWVRSSLTGTFGGAVGNNAGDRSYAFTYTISSANTWEYKTITIAGDTTGSWAKDNNGGIFLYLSIGAGSSVSTTAGSWQSGFYVSATGATSVVGTSGATFYITGVQLEKGSTATSFDYRPYGTEFDLVQRYFQKYAGFTCVGSSATEVGLSIAYITTMRATPSVSQTGVLTIENMGVADVTQSSTSISLRSNRANATGAALTLNNFSGLTQFRPFIQNVNHNGTDNYITLSAEL